MSYWTITGEFERYVRRLESQEEANTAEYPFTAIEFIDWALHHRDEILQGLRLQQELESRQCRNLKEYVARHSKDLV